MERVQRGGSAQAASGASRPIAAPRAPRAPKTLTVFTPTYNRAYKIGDLYRSLVAQTSRDFVWLVVDDGSTDGTRDLIEGFCAEGEIEIDYLWQENGGKARAHNTGVERCATELFFTVDSDDTLVPDAVEAVIDAWRGHEGDGSLAGVIAMRGRDARTPILDRFPAGMERTTVWDLWYRRRCKGDPALIYRTDVLRRYPFWVAPGERFMGEAYVYFQIDQDYELLVLPRILWITRYLPDGYTAHVRQIARENPVSYMALNKLRVDLADTLPLRFEAAILYLVAAHFAGRFSEAFRALPSRSLALAAAPGAWLLWNTEFRR